MDKYRFQELRFAHFFGMAFAAPRVFNLLKLQNQNVVAFLLEYQPFGELSILQLRNRENRGAVSEKIK